MAVTALAPDGDRMTAQQLARSIGIVGEQPGHRLTKKGLFLERESILLSKILDALACVRKVELALDSLGFLYVQILCARP